MKRIGGTDVNYYNINIKEQLGTYPNKVVSKNNCEIILIYVDQGTIVKLS